MHRPHPPLFALLLAAALVLGGCGKSPELAAPAPRAAGALRAASEPVPAALPPAPDEATLTPRFTQTGRGKAGDPINLVIAGTERQILEGFDRAGWLPADPVTFWNALRMVRAGVLRAEYPTSPMSPLRLYGRVQDQCWQKNPRSIVSRDHLRVWKTPTFDPLGRPYWAVAATKDVGVYWNKTHTTHRIDPDIDEERQLVADDWVATGAVARMSAYMSTEPGYKGLNGEGDPYVTDGRVFVLELVEEDPLLSPRRGEMPEAERG